MGDMIVCHEFCLGVEYVKRQPFPGWWKSWGGDLCHPSSFWRICLQVDKGSSEKASHYICCFSNAFRLKRSIYQSSTFWGACRWTPSDGSMIGILSHGIKIHNTYKTHTKLCMHLIPWISWKLRTCAGWGGAWYLSKKSSLNFIPLPD